VLIFGAVFTLTAIAAKVIGCGSLALLLGFNRQGALRIGTGMIPRGKTALVFAGIGLASGILDNHVFSVIILMILITTLSAPPLLALSLKAPGSGTRKNVKGNDTAQAVWKFDSTEITRFVISGFLMDLRAGGFYVQMMSIGGGLFQARKDGIALSIIEEESMVTIETARPDMPFVKTSVCDVIARLSDAVGKLKDTSVHEAVKKELLDKESRIGSDLFSLLSPEMVSVDLKGETKEEIIAELVDILASRGRLLDRELVFSDVLARERTMSTGMLHGIALPHAKSDGCTNLVAAVGIKKEGVDFESLSGEKIRIFILVVSPRKTAGPHIQFLAAIGTVLKDDKTREALINAPTAEEAIRILRQGKQ
jgi:mannitol/fructose-specific phosphotransferase system IIA component (Ntr-type)